MAISTRTTGYAVTAEDWNELVNALNNNAKYDITHFFAPPTDVSSAGIETVNSAIGTPAPAWTNVLFDAGTVETMKYVFIVPGGYSSAAKIEFAFYGTATSGSVVFQSAIVGLGAEQGTNCNFGTAVLGTYAVPGTAGIRKLGTITYTDTNGVSAGDKAMLYLQRVATATADNAGGDCKVDKVMFCYEN